MHSECLTGDVFHSSRCDCGEQLDETLNKMGDMAGGGSADAFASSSFLMFAGPCAPTHSTLVRLLRLCFWRSVSAYHARVPGVGGQQHPQSVFARRETNRSGVCLAGQRGFGKTHLLNCAAVAASALLPNFVAVVLDATSAPASHATRNDTRTVLDVLRCQFQDLGFSEIADQTNVSDLLAHASYPHVGTAVDVVGAVDEKEAAPQQEPTNSPSVADRFDTSPVS